MEPVYNSNGVRVPGMYKKGGSTPAWTRKEELLQKQVNNM
jgi:hypothetical protein